MKKINILLVLLLVISSQLYAEPPNQWVMCSSCHGPSGEGGVGPKLQGESAEEIRSDLKDYKAGKVKGPLSSLMFPMVSDLTEADIDALAKYIETL
ncbi:MAG TPA: c-type cytochrome [SAR86 cluster bacterium]|nr:c-type cytochrome [SAR86 cluster bacterium]